MATAELDTITTAALVARQSRTDDGSMSVPDQVAAMRDWCGKQKIEVGNVYTEYDVSGRKPLEKRRGLHSAVKDVEAGAAQMILTAYFDRFVRSVSTRAEVLLRVEKKKGVVYTLDMGQTSNATPISKFTGTVLAAAAELIAEQAGEKTAITKQRNIDRGIPPFPNVTVAYRRRTSKEAAALGGAQAGYYAGQLVPHERNAPLIREAIEMRLKTPAASWTTIRRFLAENGIEMEVYSIGPMFERKLMIGEIHFGEFTPNLHAIEEPIMSRSTYRRLMKQRAVRGRVPRSECLLSRIGVLLCDTCRSRMSFTSKQQGRYCYYRCADPLCVARANIATGTVDDAVRDEVIRLSGELVGRATRDSRVGAAGRARVEAEEAYDTAIRSLLGRGQEKAAREVLDELELARDKAVDLHERLLASASAGRLTVSTVADWDRLTLDEQQGVIRSVLFAVTVRAGGGDDRIGFERRGDLFVE